MSLAVGTLTFTRLLDMVFHDVKFQFVFNYLDDLYDFEDYLKYLVMDRLSDAGLTVDLDKVMFFPIRTFLF